MQTSYKDIKFCVPTAAELVREQLETWSFLRSKRVIVIAGPTGVGKTSISILLAKMLKGEIVNADSMNVYVGMDIGTAKPTKEEREQIPHHLFDVCSIRDHWNVYDFCTKALFAINEILSRGNVPIVVGGTGFYIHHLLYGPPEGPPSDISIRSMLEAEGSKYGYGELYKKLLEVDPVYARTITVNDRHKIVRALEIMMLSGKTVTAFSAFRKKQIPRTYDFRCWFFNIPPQILNKRLAIRCDEMIQAGFLDEVTQLISQGLLDNQTARNAVGYRQAIEYFQKPRTDASYKEFVERFKIATYQLAKRQRTWFRKEFLFRWIDIATVPEEVLLDLLASDYASPTPLMPPTIPPIPFVS